MNYETRVYYGAKFLNAVRPGWVDEIDLDRLDLQDGDDCVIGQLFDSWGRVGYVIGGSNEWKHWADLGFIRYELDDSREGVYGNGYNGTRWMCGVSLGMLEFAFLENEWRNFILACRASR